MDPPAPFDETAPVTGPVTAPAALRSYACNLKGCCCAGWRIPFKPGDLVRMAERIPEGERAALVADGLIIVTDDDHRTIDHIRWEGVGDDDACRFLASDGGCGAQRTYGLDALPDLCVQFPAFPYVLGGRVELHPQAICPEVVEALARDRTPFGLETVAPTPDGPRVYLDRVGRGAGALGRQAVFDADLGDDEGWAAIFGLRDRILAACADEARPALETLAAIHVGLARLDRAGGAAWRSFAVAPVDDDGERAAFRDYLVRAMGAFEAAIVARFFWRARRFMLDHVAPALGLGATPRDDVGAAWPLEARLRDWGPAVAQRVEPVEADLRPLLLRAMGLAYFSAPTTNHPDVRWSFGVVPLVVAQALRVTAALAACLDRPADVAVLKVGLVTAEYTYRNCAYPRSALPWFRPSSAAAR